MQGFFTAIDYKSILRWRLTPADLEAWASWGSERGTLSLPLQDQYRMVMDPDMLNRSPKLGSVVLEVRVSPSIMITRIDNGSLND